MDIKEASNLLKIKPEFIRYLMDVHAIPYFIVIRDRYTSTGSFMGRELKSELDPETVEDIDSFITSQIGKRVYSNWELNRYVGSDLREFVAKFKKKEKEYEKEFWGL